MLLLMKMVMDHFSSRVILAQNFWWKLPVVLQPPLNQFKPKKQRYLTASVTPVLTTTTTTRTTTLATRQQLHLLSIWINRNSNSNRNSRSSGNCKSVDCKRTAKRHPGSSSVRTWNNSSSRSESRVTALTTSMSHNKGVRAATHRREQKLTPQICFRQQKMMVR